MGEDKEPVLSLAEDEGDPPLIPSRQGRKDYRDSRS